MTMQARMKNPAAVLTGTAQALKDLEAAIDTCDVPVQTRNLVHIRVSQINGSSADVDATSALAKKQGEVDERLVAVTVWRESPYFNDAERAALALAESATRLADRSDTVPDEVWEAAVKHFDEQALAALVLQIALSNIHNRINVPTRQVAGNR
jgi:AhpD family alkylhydroperoxidase